MKGLVFNWEMARNEVEKHELTQLTPHLQAVEKLIDERTGAGHEFLGWVEWPAQMDETEVRRIQRTAHRLRQQTDVVIIIGIGGSYLGARAAVELLKPPFSSHGRGNPEIVFAGHHLDSDYLAALMDYLKDKSVALNVISKSGTTTEPAVAFRLLKNWMENAFGREEARNRIVMTTDAVRGALKSLADLEGYETYVIPDDIGGRYSVLTPVGLLPMALAGIDIESVLRGARDAQNRYREQRLTQNPCYQYAALRNLLSRKGKQTEILVSYDPAFHYVAEWWKQLFGESEGKDGKGTFPASLQLTTDLHSMGQYVQEGQRTLFETVLAVEKPWREVTVPDADDDADGLEYLAGKSMTHVNRMAMKGTAMAHADGGVPVLQLTIPGKTAYWLGHLLYFFMKACAVSGYLLGVNPFNQPGVEAYKANMFALLGKPGFEKRKEELENRWRS